MALLWTALVLAFGLLVAPAQGRAQGAERGTPLDPAALNQQAIDLSREGELAEAIDIWWAILDTQGPSYKYASVVHRNIGRNHQKLEQWAESWYHFERCLEYLSTDEKCAQWKQEVEARLADGYVRVAVTVEPASCLVVPDATERQRAYRAPLQWWFPVGARGLLLVDDVLGVRTHVVEVSSATASLPLSCSQPNIEDPRKGGPSSLIDRVALRDWLLLGGGAATVLAGGATWWTASDRLETLRADYQRDYGERSLTRPEYDEVAADWESQINERVVPYERTSYVLWGVGGAAMLTGILLAVLLPEEPDGQPQVGVLPLVPSLGGQGLSFGFSF
jgi:hypothetical protein